MIRGVVLFALLGVAFASSSATKYVEDVIQTYLPHQITRQHLHPATLPSFNVQFDSQGVYGAVYGNQYVANFTNGKANGFNQVRINTTIGCQGPRTDDRGRIAINCTLVLKQLIAEYNVSVRHGGRVITFRNTGRVPETLAQVSIESHPKTNVATVKNFQIVKMGLITPSFSGIPTSLLSFVKVLKDAYTVHVPTNLVNLLQQNFVQALRQAFAEKRMPSK